MMYTTQPQNPSSDMTAEQVPWELARAAAGAAEDCREVKARACAFGYPRCRDPRSPAEAESVIEQPEPWDGLS